MKSVTWDGKDFAAVQMLLAPVRQRGEPACRLPEGQMSKMEIWTGGADGGWTRVRTGQLISVGDDGAITASDQCPVVAVPVPVLPVGWTIRGPYFKDENTYLSTDGDNPEAPWPDYGWPLGTECWYYRLNGHGRRLIATGLTPASASRRAVEVARCATG